MASTADYGRRSEPDVPKWARDACWYQVFVSRFCNGDSSNDLPHTHAWDADWLEPKSGDAPERDELFFRRFGGDLQGLRSRLDYLSELGVNALYLNPVFASGSEHKYDAADYRHIDDSFGVAGSLDRLVGETADPGTWQFSASDRVFLDLLEEAHARGMRVVIDGAFNHVGREFWAFVDVLEKGEQSRYSQWFDIIDFGPPLRWNGWDGENGLLVRFARQGDGLLPEVEQHLFSAIRRWMDPNGDGDPSDGVDGWRLDAAEQLPHGFWKRFRKTVKACNPEALILGEIWTDPSEWLRGDEFDVVTGYEQAGLVVRFCRPGEPRYRATEFAADLQKLDRRFERNRVNSTASLLGSHDTDRLASMMCNPSRAYERDNEAGEGDPPYDDSAPGEDAFVRARMAAALQFTLPGAPMIYYGDEVGMYGGDDPYCRSPMWWHGDSNEMSPHYRSDHLEYYRCLARMRRETRALRHGDFRVLLADDARRVLVFERRTAGTRVWVLVNGSDQRQTVDVPIELGKSNWGRLHAISFERQGRVIERSKVVLDAGGLLRMACDGWHVCIIVLTPSCGTAE